MSQPIFVFSQKGPRDHTQQTKWQAQWVFYMFLEIRIVKSASSQRLLELRGTAGQHEETVFIYRKMFGVLLRRIIQFSMRRTTLVCSIVTPSWCKTYLFIGFNATPPNSNCSRNDEKFAKVLAARSKTRHYFFNVCEDLCWNRDKSTPHRSVNRRNCRTRSSWENGDRGAFGSARLFLWSKAMEPF